MTEEHSSILTPDDRSLVERLTSLTPKILRHHDVQGLSELVLHELGHDTGFGFKRATYLVDNPDFDHLVGVAGFCKDECEFHKSNMWEDPKAFHADMTKAPFRLVIKKLLKTSFKRRDVDLESTSDVLELGKMMGMDKPHYLSWNLRHGNHGLLIFEKDRDLGQWQQDLLVNVASLLGLCTL